jgi:hypothetical protein
MVFGIVAAIRAINRPPPPPLPSTAVAVRDVGPRGGGSDAHAGFGFAGGGGGGPEEAPAPPVIYDGPLIKDPDGQWYVAKSAADLTKRFRFDPRRASRVVDHGQPPRKYISFAPNVLVKAYPELLVMVDLGVKIRSAYSQKTGRGCVHASPKRTREQMEALTQRREERLQRKGELFGVDYCDDNEIAPVAPKGAKGSMVRPPGQTRGEDPGEEPAAGEAAKPDGEVRRVWTDPNGKVRSNGPPVPRKTGPPAPKH